jgi:hypothetical protein
VFFSQKYDFCRHILYKYPKISILSTNQLFFSIPSPIARRDAPFRALIFDSWFLHDSKRGGIPLIFVKEGSVKPGQKIRTFYSEKEYEVLEVGIMYPEMQPCEVRESINNRKENGGYYTIGDNSRENFFLEMTLLGVKTCGESEFDIFETKKCFPDSGKVCVN